MSDTPGPGGSPGEGPLNARNWRRVWESAEVYHGQQALGTPRNPGLPAFHPFTFMRLKNGSGSNCRRGEVLETTTSALTNLTDTNDCPWIQGVTPDLTHEAFAIYQQPTPNGKYGRAIILGACFALVTISSANHKYARLASSSRVLSSDWGGPVKILHKPSGTGEKSCLVQLGDPLLSLFCKPDANINKGNSGTVSLWKRISGTWQDTGDNLTSAYALGADVKSGKLCSLLLHDHQWLVAPWEC